MTSMKHLKVMEYRPDEGGHINPWYWECGTCAKTDKPVWGWSRSEVDAKEDFKHHRQEWKHK